MTLSFALFLHKTSPLSFSALALFVLFPRLVLRPLPEGCQGRLAVAALLERFAEVSFVSRCHGLHLRAFYTESVNPPPRASTGLTKPYSSTR